MIALLTPTRNRPEQFKRMCESASKTAVNKSAIKIYSASNGEDAYAKYQFPVDCPTVFMWNELAKIAMQDESNKLFMLCADDVIFTTPCFDEALLNHYNALENKIHVYALQDSRDADGHPHVIVTREYIKAMGWFLPPYFLHWKVDVWTVAIAKANDCFTHLKDYLLVHDKLSDKGSSDETHNRIRRMGWRERDAVVGADCHYLLAYEKQRLRDELGPMNWVIHINRFVKDSLVSQAVDIE